MYCIVLYCIVLYCIVLYCIVLYWRSRAARKGNDQNFENYELEALNKILEDFAKRFLRKDGQDNKPDILRTAIDRYQRRQAHKYIIGDRGKKRWKQALEGKADG